MNASDRAALRLLAEQATPGPWGWFGSTRGYNVYLATKKWGRRFVMQFERWGMSAAQPVFQIEQRMVRLSEFVEVDHNREFGEINHPDAKYIAGFSPDVALSLLDALDRAESATLGAQAAEPDALKEREDPADVGLTLMIKALDEAGFEGVGEWGALAGDAEECADLVATALWDHLAIADRERDAVLAENSRLREELAVVALDAIHLQGVKSGDSSTCAGGLSDAD